MSEVTLINPLTAKKWRLPPLGILYVASYLEKHGVSVKVIDPLSQGKEDYHSESRYTGITCMSNQFQKAKQIAKRVKKENPETITVLGGVHPTVATDEAMADPNIDIVVVGESERAMLKIVLEDIKHGVVYGERVQNLDEIPPPARHLVNMGWYLKRYMTVVSEWLKSTSVLTSRGCPFNCNYCINSKHAMFGRRIRYHSPDYVEREVEQLVSTYGLDGVFFADDNFTTHKDRLVDICRRIRRFGLKWNCVSRVDAVNKRILEAMKNSGCVSIGFGVESGSQKVLDALNKRTKVEDAIKAFDLCHQVGIKTWAFIIIGNPQETRDDIISTDKLLERLKADTVAVSYLMPYKGTVIYDQAAQNGWLIRDDSNLSTDEPQMEIGFTLKELAEIGRYLNRKHNSKLRELGAYMKNPHFLCDALALFAKEPSVLLKRAKS